jgi:hypothetical protein
VSFEVLVIGIETARNVVFSRQVVFVDVLTLSDLVGGSLVVAFLYGFFAHLVFPRFGDRLYADTSARALVRRDWLVSAVVYGVALLVAVPVLYAFVPS